ncbi:MAG: S-layer homology domain-containing protein [Oscillospiraceae bacterium]|nr:S-layer homology domain-containing protein [Oscillospiraceae bacterium]
MISFWRAAGQPAADGDPAFVDTARDAYYYDAFRWAYGNGVTTGTGEDTFSPDGACTRAQVVTFLWRAAGEA